MGLSIRRVTTNNLSARGLIEPITACAPKTCSKWGQGARIMVAVCCDRRIPAPLITRAQAICARTSTTYGEAHWLFQ
jgi:hypothetical protein